MLTGSCSANASGRLPMADMAHNLLSAWQDKGLGLQVGGDCPPFCLMTYVDNLIAVGPTARANVELLQSAEDFLQSRWNLRFGNTSREVLPCAAAPASSLPED